MKESTIGFIMGLVFFGITALGMYFTSPQFWWLPGIVAIPIIILTILGYISGIASFAKAISDAIHGR